jgi:PAS domain S-box-containing protein
MKLRTKLFIFALPVYLVVVVVMTSLAQSGVRTLVEQGEYRRGLGVALGVAQNEDAIGGFHASSENRLLKHLQGIQEHAQALYAVALSPSGRVLAHTNVAEVGKTYTDLATLALLRSDIPGYSLGVIGGLPVMDLAVPVIAAEAGDSEAFLLMDQAIEGEQARLGTLRIGLPMGDAQSTADRISNQVFWIITIGSTMALVIGLVIIGRLLRPIRRLAMATEQVGHGNFGETIPVSSKDEMGDLAERFNRMSLDLATTTVSKEYNDNILRSMNDALIVVVPEGHIETVNVATCDLLGYDESELEGQPFGLVVGAKSDLLKGDRIIRNIEQVYRAKDGREIPIRLSGAVIRDALGTVVGTVYAARDIRSEKEAFEARRQLERQLIQSERMAAVGTVAAGIVHNLKNPLNGIIGFADLLSLQLPGKLEVDRIVSSAMQMNEMIENILAKSRHKKTPERVDINQLLTYELDFLEADAVFKFQIRKEINLDDQLPKIVGVYTDLSQVFGNFLRNAVEAMYDQEEKVLRVTTTHWKDKGVLVEIGDTGCGISEADLSQMFNPFFTTKTGDGNNRPKGTGLGLYTVKELLDSYSGQIEVSSKVEVGTTFKVCLPYNMLSDA